MTPELFKRIMRRQAATVALITTDGGDRGDRAGLTATSLTSVSADPPLVLFCVARTASAWPALSVTDRIGIHLLGEDSQELAHRFATTGIDRFDHPAIGDDDGRTSVADAVAWLECRIVDRIPAGDHHIVLAAPERGGHSGRDQPGPLLYHDRRYTSVTEPKPGEVSADGAETVEIINKAV
ncbi:flavin reductase (DIM6/NTAB) family NADH-FMN oxidoreductase RutF [Streptomyces sp. LBL]|uniref:flavin reductase family protein n=1 Tax=Streptomyces sp. LBL TaxID=2940562 RepID=UPI00247318A9|nr:flavin reductase family protein [Streptomyces sp. LBL]MDH6622736.1 flavin reductase (DIM6/NTAB) family NADH-FMN oxidoreductase RutF [Streptomyces sp. LBL]